MKKSLSKRLDTVISKNIHLWTGNFGVYKIPFAVIATKKGLLDKRQKRYSEMVDWIDAQEAKEAGVTVEQLRKAVHGSNSNTS